VTFVTKADANAWLANQQSDTGRGVWVDPSFGKELSSHYAPKWLETWSDLEDTTPAKYEGLLRLHILPAFGYHRIAHVDPAAVGAGTTPWRPSTRASATTPTGCSGPL
jgi:hypothetical protein